MLNVEVGLFLFFKPSFGPKELEQESNSALYVGRKEILEDRFKWIWVSTVRQGTLEQDGLFLNITGVSVTGE